MTARMAQPEPAVENYRIDHYYSIESEGEFSEGHVFCTPEEAEVIKAEVEKIMRAYGYGDDFSFSIEGGGEYDFTTEDMDAASIASDIVIFNGFMDQHEENE